MKFIREKKPIHAMYRWMPTVLPTWSILSVSLAEIYSDRPQNSQNPNEKQRKKPEYFDFASDSLQTSNLHLLQRQYNFNIIGKTK